MAISNNMSEEDSINRRQFLVKVGSFMKQSWRRSNEMMIDARNDTVKRCNDGTRDQKIDTISKKKKMFVQFDHNMYIIPHNNNIVSDKQNNGDDDGKVEDRWYQRDDYCRFKKDTILSSLNYMNAQRNGSKSKSLFDENKYSIRGIEHMCCTTPSSSSKYHQHQHNRIDTTSHKKAVRKVIFEEQKRQKVNGSYPNIERFRAVSIPYTNNERDRAISRGKQYAREQKKEQQKKKEQQQRQQNQRWNGHPSSHVKHKLLFGGIKNKSKNSNIKNIIKSTVTSATTTPATARTLSMTTPSIVKTTIMNAAA